MFVASGCWGKDEELQAMAVPTSTGIPIAPPGAVGADVDPTAPRPRGLRAPRTEELEQKINPEPGKPAEPVIPPSPFGAPPDPDDEPVAPPTTKKKPQGTKI